MSYDTNSDNLFWLINDTLDSDTNEPSFDFPTDENQRCIFGLDCSNLEDTAKSEQIIEVLQNYNFGDADAVMSDYDSFIFYDTFKNGVKKMKEVTEEINLLTNKRGSVMSFTFIEFDPIQLKKDREIELQRRRNQYPLPLDSKTREEIVRRCAILVYLGDDGIGCDYNQSNDDQLVDHYSWVLDKEHDDLLADEFVIRL
jgi:uncharacterized protein YuzE